MSVFVKEIIKDLKENPTHWRHKSSNSIVNYDLEGREVVIKDLGNTCVFSLIDVVVENCIKPRVTYIDRFNLERAYQRWSKNTKIENL